MQTSFLSEYGVRPSLRPSGRVSSSLTEMLRIQGSAVLTIIISTVWWFLDRILTVQNRSGGLRSPSQHKRCLGAGRLDFCVRSVHSSSYFPKNLRSMGVRAVSFHQSCKNQPRNASIFFLYACVELHASFFYADKCIPQLS